MQLQKYVKDRYVNLTSAKKKPAFVWTGYRYWSLDGKVSELKSLKIEVLLIMNQRYVGGSSFGLFYVTYQNSPENTEEDTMK
jgi:hypothetical protein